MKYLTVADATANSINPAFQTWEQQDQLLLSWLQSTISRDMLTRIIGCKTSSQLWDKIHEHFQINTQARSRQLRCELRATTLESLSISKYLLKIQTIVNSLSAIGEPISSREHLDVILEGLPQEYESTISIICGRPGLVSIAEAETLLLGHESRLARFNKHLAVTPSANVASTQSSQSDTKTVTPQAFVAESTDSNSDNTSGGWRGGRGGRGGRGRGRNTTQCQVCHKIGHDASVCFHRYKRDYVPGASSQPRASNSSSWQFAPPWHAPIWNQMLQTPPRAQYPQQSLMAPYFGSQFMMPSPMLPASPFVASPQRPQFPQAFMAAATTAPHASPDWFADSACTQTMSTASHNIQQTAPFTGPDQVIIGNGTRLPIKSVGFTNFRSPMNPKRVLSLKNVLHVPGLTKNLLSVKQFSKDNGVYFQFNDNHCLVKSQDTMKHCSMVQLIMKAYTSSPIYYQGLLQHLPLLVLLILSLLFVNLILFLYFYLVLMLLFHTQTPLLYGTLDLDIPI